LLGELSLSKLLVTFVTSLNLLTSGFFLTIRILFQNSILIIIIIPHQMNSLHILILQVMTVLL
jgi:hypothetical protein